LLLFYVQNDSKALTKNPTAAPCHTLPLVNLAAIAPDAVPKRIVVVLDSPMPAATPPS